MSIIQKIIYTAESVDLLLDKSGVEKKALVLENLKLQLGTEVYDRYYFLICETIDFIINVSKNGLKTTINTNVDLLKKDCSKLFSCCK
jgi:type III secretion system FlhB-like substrate exporter